MRGIVGASAGLLLLLGAIPGRGCPFCAKMGPPLHEQIGGYPLVVVGRPLSSQFDEQAAIPGAGTTRVAIRRVLRDEVGLGQASGLVLSRALDWGTGPAAATLFFLEPDPTFPGRYRPLRGVELLHPDVVPYLGGALRVADTTPERTLLYFADWLDHSDSLIATDAYKVFASTDYQQVVSQCRTLDPALPRRWLADPHAPSYRLGLTGLLLGVCGEPEDADVLRRRWAELEVGSGGVDGLMAGYCLLRPERGQEMTLATLADADRSFEWRYAALRAVRFLLDRADAEQRSRLLRGMLPALARPDARDLIIDEFRDRGAWSVAGAVLRLEVDGTDQLVRRAQLRYALECPTVAARDWVGRLRRRDPAFVARALDLERETELVREGIPVRR